MKKRFLSILLVLVMVIGMIPFSALSASAASIGLADFYTTVTIGDDVYDVATMPGNPSGEGYYVTSTGPAELVIELRDYNGGPIKVESDNRLISEDVVIPIIKVYGDCVITVPDNYDGYGIEFLSEYVLYYLDFEFVEDASLTIQGGGGGICVTGESYLTADQAYHSSHINFASNPFAKLNIDVDGGYGIYMPSFRDAFQKYASGIEKPLINIKTSAEYTVAYFDQDDNNSYVLETLTSWSNAEYHKLTAIGGTIYAGSSLSSSMGSENSFESGTTVKLVAPEIAGKYFTGWEFSREDVPFTDEEKKQSKLIFEMPSCDLTATATYINLDIGFASLTPTPDMPQEDWDEVLSDLGTMALGSSDTNIDFNFSAKTLTADAIEAGYSVKRALKVTRDGITVYDKEYAFNEVYGWNLKDNIDEGGNYQIIPTLNYYLNGVKVEEISHLYTVKVTGSTIKTLTASGIATPVIGSAPSSGEFAKTNTDGVYIYEIEWFRAEENSYSGWVMMTEGETFATGERYKVTVTFKTNDGYSFKEDPTLMKAYINGVEATVVENPYSKNKAYVDLEMTPITTPAFIVKPVGGNVAEGDKFTITWETNFKPAWIEILSFNSANGAPNKAIKVPADATSFELDANEFGYVLNVYYNGNQCVSNGEKIYVNEIKTIINTIELQVAKPVIGEAPTKPTIKSVNMDENLKDLVSFFSDSKVYWVEADSAEDIANGNKHPTVFADGKIYALHVAIQSTKEIGEDCYLQVYDTNGERLWAGYVSFSDPSDKTLVYTDAYLGNFKLEIGNVNGDDLIDFTDLQRLYQHITGDNPLSGDALGAADVNADTVIDFSDLQALFALLSQNA